MPDPRHPPAPASLDLGPLPIKGRSWPKSVACLAWAVLGLIALRFLYVASTVASQSTTPLIAASLLALLLALVVIAYYMWTGQTSIDDQGIRQSWVMRREITWNDIRFAKFIPLLGSKRLICFSHKGRPVVFQGATPELQIAFAKISLQYKRQPDNK